MAEIKPLAMWRQLRSDASVHIQLYQRGRRVRSGRGLAFWFMPDGASIAEVPMDDRDLPFIFNTRSKDFQEVTVQGGSSGLPRPASLVARPAGASTSGTTWDSSSAQTRSICSVAVISEPLGKWSRRTPVWLLLRCCPPGPPAVKVSTRDSASMVARSVE